jgi:hypothetical protein
MAGGFMTHFETGVKRSSLERLQGLAPHPRKKCAAFCQTTKILMLRIII